MSIEQESGERGFILIYTVLAISLFLGLAGSVVSGTIRSLKSSDDERAAAVAAAAADGGFECVAHHQLTGGVSVWTEGGDINCDTGTTGTYHARLNNLPDLYDRVNLNAAGLPDCTVGAPVVHTLTMNYPNGSCAVVSVTVEDGPLVCEVTVNSRGLDNCANPTVERVIWEDIEPTPNSGSWAHTPGETASNAYSGDFITIHTVVLNGCTT